MQSGSGMNVPKRVKYLSESEIPGKDSIKFY